MQTYLWWVFYSCCSGFTPNLTSPIIDGGPILSIIQSDRHNNSVNSMEATRAMEYSGPAGPQGTTISNSTPDPQPLSSLPLFNEGPGQASLFFPLDMWITEDSRVLGNGGGEDMEWAAVFRELPRSTSSY